MRYARLVLAFMMLVGCAQTGVPTVCSGGPGQPYTCRPSASLGMQQQQPQQEEAAIIRDAQAGLQPIVQRCEQRMQMERELDPIRTKVMLFRTAITGAPPPGILANQSTPTAEEKAAIAKWATMGEECVQEEMRYGLSLSLPPNLMPLRDKIVLTGRQTHQQVGLLIAALYDGRLTYGQFAIQNMNIVNQMMAPAPGSVSSTTPRQNLAVGPQIPSATSGDEIRLQKKGNSYQVPVAVNGLPPMPFVLDSGADIVALPAEVVFTLLRTGTLRSSDFIGDKTFVLADGRELPSLTFRIRELRVGQHVIRDAVGSLNPALTDPLLGGSFLSRFASWKIDNQRNTLVLSR